MNTAEHAFLFPGQGAQTLGMAVDLVEASPYARAVYERAWEILEEDFLTVCRDGPEALLNSTRVSQPAIFLHSMAVLAVLAGERVEDESFCEGIEAKGTAGLSLGEYSALVFAGSLRFDDALRIVTLRGQYMQQACEETAGSMASILGLPAAQVEDVLTEMKGKNAAVRIGVANYNASNQTVISGDVAGVKAAIERLKEAGAKRAIALRVAGAYHSELMAPATAKLAPLLEELPIHEPRVPFYPNVTGSQVSDPEEIRSGLIRQVESSVRWVSIMKALLEAGLEGAYELGPGRVLKGLMKSVARGLPVVCLGTAASLQSEQMIYH